MLRVLSAALFTLAFLLFASATAQDKNPGEFGALPPHPLDGAFERGNSERDITNALLNNKLYQKAVAEALKAKRAQEAQFRANPQLRAASPAQAARVKFLEVLQNEKRE